jgi:hypothetical protein
MYAPKTELNKTTILEYLYRVNRDVSGDDIRIATGVEPQHINDAIELLYNSGLVEKFATLGCAPYRFKVVRITAQGKLSVEKKKSEGKYTVSAESDSTPSKVDRLQDAVGHTNNQLKNLSDKIDRLTSTIEDASYLRPKFLESSPAQRTFGKEIEGILTNILQSGSKKVEIHIMGYFDHESLDKLKEVLAGGGKVKIIYPELTSSKQDRGNLDALRRIEESGADIKIHPMLHARIFYLSRDGQPWGAVVGSGDIKSDCLGGRRFDAGIWSNYPDILKSVADFFSRVWNDKGAMKLSDIKSP